MNRFLHALSAIATSLLTALPGRAAAQGADRPAAPPGAEWDSQRLQMTQAALQDLLKRLDAAATSPAYSGAIRDHARVEAAAVRARLAEGDLQVGDRVYLQVEGEQQLTDSFTVGPARVLTLPIVGDVPLAGVLHADLESYLQQAIGKYVRDPVVHARSPIRIAIVGEVNRQGYYIVPTQTVLSDALMLAGGPTHEANLENLRIERAEQRVWEGQALQQAIAEGKTIDQLSLRAGDRLRVPTKGTSWFNGPTLRIVGLLLAVPATIYAVRRLSH